jgi:hypothetical protein
MSGRHRLMFWMSGATCFACGAFACQGRWGLCLGAATLSCFAWILGRVSEGSLP